MFSIDTIRSRLGILLVIFSIISLVLLAIIALIAASRVDADGKSFLATTQLLLSSLLPLFGTWVGTVLAFYFSKDNFEAASRGTLDVVRSVSPRLVAMKVSAAMMSRTKMVTLDLPAGKTLENVIVGDVKTKFATPGTNGQRISRLPVLDSEGRYVAFFHRGVWNEMLVGAKPALDDADAIGPGLAANYPLRQGQTYKQAVTTAAVVFVSKDSSVADAKARMEAVAGCQDAIVTDHGLASEPVVGWISNIDIGRVSQA